LKSLAWVKHLADEQLPGLEAQLGSPSL